MRRKPGPTCLFSAFLPSTCHWQQLIYFLSLGIWLFWTFYLNEIIQYDILLSLSKVFFMLVHAIHPYHSMPQCPIYFYWWIEFCYMKPHILFIHLSPEGDLSCFHFLSIMNNVAIIFWVETIFISPGYISRNVTSESCGHSAFNLLKNFLAVFQKGLPHSASPTAEYEGSPFSISSPARVIFCPCDYNHPTIWVWSLYLFSVLFFITSSLTIISLWLKLVIHDY